MHVENALMPNAEQMAGFTDPTPDGPIYMLNLLKFRPKAEYADGRRTDLTGVEAYRLYGQGVSQLVAELGGSIVFSAEVERLTIGEVEDLWDMVAIAMYPSRAAMLKMMQSDRMREIGEHRRAGLAGQLNIECRNANGLGLSAPD